MLSKVDPKVFSYSFRESLKKPGSLPFAAFAVGETEELAMAKWAYDTTILDLKNGGLFRLLENLIVKEAFLQENPNPENQKYQKLEARTYEFLFGREWEMSGEFRDLGFQETQELFNRLRKEGIEIKKPKEGLLEIGFSKRVKRRRGVS